MKTRLVLSLSLAALTAAGLAGAAGDAGASCAAGVSFDGVFYTQTQTRDGVARGASVQGGVQPGCDDVVVLGPDGQRLDEPEPDVPVELLRIRGVSTKLAVTRPDQPGVFLAPGTFPQLPRHPLHTALHGSRRAPDATEDRSCGPRTRHRGVLLATPPAGGEIALTTSAGLDLPVIVDARTRFRGARRVAGQPVVAAGDALTVTGRRCAGPYEAPLVALRIRVRPAR